ncbi:MAG TPA: DUF1016 N-terminal domain-containing protein [Arachnia sp.]|nr:DUF1016 N-terminal domain-containing protein [Arachnia sp.]HMT86956.1 DUF1016 N-terminal domain-containing protein [Arachnia sp.]
MSELDVARSPTPSGSLFERIAALVEQTRTSVATYANSALTMMYWQIGHLIDADVLQHERAAYAQEIVGTLSPQLTRTFGRGFDRNILTRMVRFAQQFPDQEIVATLSQQLSWSHIATLLPVRGPEARAFYVDQAV